MTTWLCIWAGSGVIGYAAGSYARYWLVLRALRNSPPVTYCNIERQLADKGRLGD